MANTIRIAIAGLGNCAGALIEGIGQYRAQLGLRTGLLFERLGGYTVADIEIVTAFDIAATKVGRPISEAIYGFPNCFQRNGSAAISAPALVLRGPTLDGNPRHLSHLVEESNASPVNIEAALRENRIDVLLNLLPTGSHEATELYARAALEAAVSFINCIPTPIAQRPDIAALFSQKRLVLMGDDCKSQVGTTALHQALLALLQQRGACLQSTSQLNIGGNTDFLNFTVRGESKLRSKRQSLSQYCQDERLHLGHHYDPTRGAFKTAFIDLKATVFGGSSVTIAVRLDSDDKPNCAGSVVDLIRITKAAIAKGLSGVVHEACALYMKSPPRSMEDSDAMRLVRRNYCNDEASC